MIILALNCLCRLGRTQATTFDTTVFTDIIVAFRPTTTEMRLINCLVYSFGANVTSGFLSFYQCKLPSWIQAIAILPKHTHSMTLLTFQSLSSLYGFYCYLQVFVFLKIHLFSKINKMLEFCIDFPLNFLCYKSISYISFGFRLFKCTLSFFQRYLERLNT